MRITYDPEVDALYIELKSTPPVDSIDLAEGVTVDLDADGLVVGIEVLDAKRRLGDEALDTVALERLPLIASAPAVKHV